MLSFTITLISEYLKVKLSLYMQNRKIGGLEVCCCCWGFLLVWLFVFVFVCMFVFCGFLVGFLFIGFVLFFL